MNFELQHDPNSSQRSTQDSVLKSFFESSPFMMGIADLEGNDVRHVADNPAASAFFGIPLEKMQGRLSSELRISRANTQEWVRHYREAEEHRIPIQFVYQHEAVQGPRWFSVTVNFIKNNESGSSRFSYIVQDITDMHDAEMELVETKRRLERHVRLRTEQLKRQNAEIKAVFNSVEDGIAVFNLEGEIILMNDAQSKFHAGARTKDRPLDLGFFSEHFLLTQLSGQALSPERWPISRILRGETIKDLVLRGERTDRDQHWYLSFTGEPIRDETGNQILALCITRDITRQKEIELGQREILKDLADSEARYRYLFYNNPQPMFVFDRKTLEFLDVNSAALEFYGYDRDEFLSFRLPDIRPTNEQARMQEVVEQEVTAQNFYIENLTHLKKDGSVALVQVYRHDLNFRNKDSRLVLVHDVTERVRAEANLTRTVHELKKTLKTLSDYKFALEQGSILVTTDAKGIITYVNDKFCEISKFSREELVGTDQQIMDPRFHTEEYVMNFWTKIMTGKVWKGEICHRAKDGGMFWVDTVIIPFVLEGTRPYQYMAIMNDITERRRATVALEEAVRSRDEFLSIASHELKTPLTSWKLQTQMYKRTLERNPNINPQNLLKYFNHADTQVKRLTHLVDDMLDISRISTGKLSLQLERIDFVEVITEVIADLSDMFAQVGCTVDLKVPEFCFGEWDRFRIEQVVVNLLLNAAKYGQGKPIEIALLCQPKFCRLTIRDKGRGIAPQDQSRIFHRFERAISAHEVSGLGLGLYISNQIIQMHGGKIEVESELGLGSSFSVTLPTQNNEIPHS